MVQPRSALGILILLSVALAAVPASAQEFEQQLRSYQVLDFGPIRFEGFTVAEIENRGRDVYADHQELTYLVRFRNGHMVLRPEGEETFRAPLGEVQMVGTFRVDKGALEHPVSWSGTAGDLRISLASLDGPAARLFGSPLAMQDPILYARSVTPVELSAEGASGLLEFKVDRLRLPEVEMHFPGSADPWSGDLRTTRPLRMRLDLATASLVPVSGDLEVASLEPAEAAAEAWRLDRFHLTGVPKVGPLSFRTADGGDPELVLSSLEFESPVTHYQRRTDIAEPLWELWPELVPVEAVGRFTAGELRGAHRAGADRLEMQALVPDTWVVEPDPVVVADLVARQQRLSVVPVGDENVPFVSVGALTDVYSMLTVAEDDPGRIPRGYLEQTEEGFALELRTEAPLAAAEGEGPLSRSPLACIAIGKATGKAAGKSLEAMMRLNARPAAKVVAVAASLTLGPEIGLPLAWATYGVLHCGAKPAGWVTAQLVGRGTEEFCEYMVGQATATPETMAFSPFAEDPAAIRTSPDGLPYADLTSHGTHHPEIAERVRAQIQAWQQVLDATPVSGLDAEGTWIAERSENRRETRSSLRRQATIWTRHARSREERDAEARARVVKGWQSASQVAAAKNRKSLRHSHRSIRAAQQQKEASQEFWRERSMASQSSTVEIPLNEIFGNSGSGSNGASAPGSSSNGSAPVRYQVIVPEDEIVIRTRPASSGGTGTGTGTSDPGPQCGSLGPCYNIIFAPVPREN